MYIGFYRYFNRCMNLYSGYFAFTNFMKGKGNQIRPAQHLKRLNLILRKTNENSHSRRIPEI